MTFARQLSSSSLIVTAECLSPRGVDPEAVRRLSSMMPARVNAIVVPDNPDRIRSSALSTARILLRERGGDVVMSIGTRDRNRIALMSDVLGAAALGISSILCVSGRHQSSGICSEAASAHDLDSVQLTQAMKRLVLYGEGLGGKLSGGAPELQVGAIGNPYLRPIELSIHKLKKKVQAGADFLLTQAVFDLEGFAEWMDAVREAGLDKRTAIIASVLPLESLDRAIQLRESRMYGPAPDAIVRRMSEASDQEREGVEIAAEIARRLKEMPGVRGIHILCGGCERLAAAVIQRALL